MADEAPALPFDFRRNIDLRLDAEGRWFHDGEPFTNERIVALFNRGIDVLVDTGEPILRVGTQWCYIRCDDTPFIVKMARVGLDQLVLTLNTESTLVLDPEALRVDSHGVLYAELAPGQRARFSRAGQAALASWLEERDDGRPCMRVGARRYFIDPLT